MKKKIFVIVLMMAIVLLLSANIFVSAAAEPTVTVESVNVESGKTAKVKVFIENNPGMWGMDLRIGYDKTKLTLVKVENGEVYSNDEWTEGNLKGEEYILSYARNDFQDTKNNGLLATLTFDINNPKNSGSYDVTATYRAGDVINVNFGEIVFKITNGKVNVKGTSTEEHETTPVKTPEVSSAPQLNTFEAAFPQQTDSATVTNTPDNNDEAILTEAPENTDDVQAPEQTVLATEKPEEVSMVGSSEDNVFIIVLVGALVIFTAFYILIKRKNKQ